MVFPTRQYRIDFAISLVSSRHASIFHEIAKFEKVANSDSHSREVLLTFKNGFYFDDEELNSIKNQMSQIFVYSGYVSGVSCRKTNSKANNENQPNQTFIITFNDSITNISHQIYSKKHAKVNQIKSDAIKNLYQLKKSNIENIKSTNDALELSSQMYMKSYIKEIDYFLDRYIKDHMVVRVENLVKRKKVQLKKCYRSNI